MVIISVATVVVAIALVVLSCFAIPVLIELRKTLAELRQFTTSTEQQMKPLLQDLHETLADLKSLTMDASERVEEVRNFHRGSQRYRPPCAKHQQYPRGSDQRDYQFKFVADRRKGCR